LFAQAASRSEVVCTFLAVLELIRMKQLICTQPEPFAEIEITSSHNVALTSSPLPAGASVPLAEPVPTAGLEPVVGTKPADSVESSTTSSHEESGGPS
jgi:hypothetical protein